MPRKSRQPARSSRMRRHVEAPPPADAIAEPAGQPVIAETVPPPIAIPVSPAPRLPDRYQAVLASNQRGSILTRKVPTWEGAFVQAHQLLSHAETREWHRGEVVSVRVEPAQE